MDIPSLLQLGVARELEKRGVAAPDLTAAGMMKTATIDGQNMMIDNMPVNEYLDKFCESAPQQKVDNWQPPTPEAALNNLELYEQWMQHDPEGCEEAFQKLQDGYAHGLGY